MRSETITCSCGDVFQWTPAADCDEWLASMSRPSSCPECSHRIQVERREQERIESEARITKHVAHITAKIDAATPPIFRRTDTSHPSFNAAGWQRVRNSKPTEEKPWLGLIGETGTCKSRIAYLLARTAIERMARQSAEKVHHGYRQPTFAFLAAYEITDAAARLHAADFKEKDKARDYLAELRRVDFLIVDDLGKGRLSPAIAAELFALVDHRYCHALPMIWTANSTPEAIAANLAEDMAAPFAGRLNDSSRIIRFK